METLNVIWCQGWGVDGPTGCCRDLGSYAQDEVAAAVRRGWYDASRQGWGAGRVVVTDANGEMV